MRIKFALMLVVLVLILVGANGVTARYAAAPLAAPQTPIGTAFTYQGQLTSMGTPVTGNCDMVFRLYDAAQIGNQVGDSITTTVPINNGLFTASLDFGAGSFDGTSRWLDLQVKCGSDGTYTAITPRYAITPVPYAAYADSAAPAHATGQTTFYYPPARPQALDLATIDPDLRGFAGGFTDGRYGYFVPYVHEDMPFGKVARVDSQDFSPTGVKVLDLTAFDPGLKGFNGGFSDGRYGYFVPIFATKLARVDLQDFSLNGVEALDLITIDPDLKGFSGGFTDGRYGYLVPHYVDGVVYSKIVQFDLSNFSATGVKVLDLATIDPDLKGFQGGFTAGRYGYFIPRGPITPMGKLVRIDLRNFTRSGVTILNLASISPDLKGFDGGFTDGRYGYLAPQSNDGGYFGKLVRVDLLNFTPAGVTVLDLSTIDPALKGFDGGFTDGRYAYFSPNTSGNAVRVDLQNFTPSGVDVMDFTNVSSDLRGFIGGFTDIRYGYFVPGYNSTWDGKIARIMLMSGNGSH